jgi:hypothetical protein
MARLGFYGRGILVLISAPGSLPRGERGGCQGEGVAGAGWGEIDEDGVRAHGGTRQTEKDCSDTVGVWHVSAGPFGIVRCNPILSDIQAPAIPNL